MMKASVELQIVDLGLRKSILEFAQEYNSNAGMPAIRCPEAVDAIEDGDSITVDMEAGVISTPRGDFRFPAYPPTVMEILEHNGLIPFIKSKIST